MPMAHFLNSSNRCGHLINPMRKNHPFDELKYLIYFASIQITRVLLSVMYIYKKWLH